MSRRPKTAPFATLTTIHAWLCQRAGADQVAIYRLKDISDAINIPQATVSTYIKRIFLSNGLQPRGKVYVDGELCRADVINPTFIPISYAAMDKKLAQLHEEKRPYRPLPEREGYNDPYTCAAPLLAFLAQQADARNNVSFNLEELKEFGSQAIVLATIHYLFFKGKIKSIRPPETGFKNYNVRILGEMK